MATMRENSNMRGRWREGEEKQQGRDGWREAENMERRGGSKKEEDMTIRSSSNTGQK